MPDGGAGVAGDNACDDGVYGARAFEGVGAGFGFGAGAGAGAGTGAGAGILVLMVAMVVVLVLVRVLVLVVFVLDLLSRGEVRRWRSSRQQSQGSVWDTLWVW